MKTTEKSSTEEIHVEYKNRYVPNGDVLQPLTMDYETAVETNQSEAVEKKFKSKKELSELVLKNGKVLFGENTLLVDLEKQKMVAFTNGFFPDGILFDLTNTEKPKVYLLEIILSTENFATLFMQMAQLFTFFKNKEGIVLFRETLAKDINKNIGFRNKLKQNLGEKKIPEFLQEVTNEKPAVLLVMDSFKQELTGIMEAYTDTWGKYVKPIIIRKFSRDGKTFYTMVPEFSEIQNGKKNSKEGKVKATEADHLENVSETVREVFRQIKEELLQADSSIEFRVKQHYISLRKKRNLAFFQFGKKKLSIVVANPEKETCQQIKHHEVRLLADSVKRFWNGNEHCFTVVLENREHLSEITSPLKKLITEGATIMETTLKVSLKKEKSDAASALDDKADKSTSQAKPKNKKSRKR